ncbi:MAG: aldo/keto reductase [Spirochaetales bacterium]|nr:aldo/keto reductase [Spirochaetales bacterium]
MDAVSLGLDGPRVSEVALGTWTFAGDAIWGASEERRCIRVVHAALDRGITLFDTAPNYGGGRSERILGSALRRRSDAFVATKLKIEGVRPEDIRSATIESLRRLHRDTIDLMQIHWPASAPGETAEALATFEKMRREGLVRHIGVCNFGVYDLDELAAVPVVSNQLPYSALWRVIEGDIAGETVRRGLTTIAYSVLQQGLLSGAYESPAAFPEGRKRTRHFDRTRPAVRHSEQGMEGETEAALGALQTLSRALGRPLREIALAFVRSRPFIDVMLIGARTEEQLVESAEAAEFDLTEADVRAVERATADLLAAAGGNPDMYLTESRVRFRGRDGEATRGAENNRANASS